MAKGVNPLIAGLQRKHQAELDGMRDFVQQLCCDVMLIAANAEFGFGPERLKKLHDTYEAAYDEYADLIRSDAQYDKGLEYAKGKIDLKLKQILGDYFESWEQRYG